MAATSGEASAYPWTFTRQKKPPQSPGWGLWEVSGGGTAAVHKLVFLLLYVSSAPFGNYAGTHTTVLAASQYSHSVGERSSGVLDCTLWVSLAFLPLWGCVAGRKGQNAVDSEQINQLLRARLGPVLHMKALGKWTLDLWLLDKVWWLNLSMKRVWWGGKPY